MNILPWKNVYFQVLISILATLGIEHCLVLSDDSLIYSNSIFAFLLCCCLGYGVHKLTKEVYWERIKNFLNPCFVFSMSFVGSMIAGVQLDKFGQVSFGEWKFYVYLICVSVAVAPFVAWIICKLESYSVKKSLILSNLSATKYFFCVWAVLFLMYVPTLLASFPGFFTYDAETEAYMVFTEKYSAHHPIAHVLLLGGLIRIMYRLTGSYNVGIAVYTILQMAVLSACFSYMMTFLHRIGVRRFVCNLGILFLGLFPTVSMFVCCSTKDGYFSGGIVLFTTLLLELAKEGEVFWKLKYRKFVFIFATVLILFFRNNGIYAYVAFLIIFAFVYNRMWKKWLPVMISGLLIFVIGTTGLSKLFDFKKGPIAEMFCVPMQQLARVHEQKKDSFPAKDLETLYCLIPEVILENYNPKLADNIKVNFMEDNFKKEPEKYISLWFRMGIKHMDIYVNSFLVNTYGYWYPDTVLDGYRGKWIVDREYEDSSYFAFVTERPGERIHLFPMLENFYEKISLEIYQQKMPVISMLFSVGFWHWIYIFVAMYLFLTKYKKQSFAFVMIGLVYLTVLLGPIALVRYVLYAFFAIPIVLALLFDTKVFASEEQ